MSATLARLFAEGGPLLLDFDGPICSIFANYPAPQVAAELVDLLQARGVDLPTEVAAETDPLEVLRWTGATGRPELTKAVEDALCAAEVQAAATAEPTPYAREVIVAARQAGMPVAVVSNNSAGAVRAYLEAHRLDRHVSPIVGRAYAEPARMKPNPAPILDAVRSLGTQPARCVLVGDSLTDIEGSRAAGVRVIGYANRGTKASEFQQAEADVVITSMEALAATLIVMSHD